MVVRISRSKAGSVATLRVEGHLDRDSLVVLDAEAHLAGANIVIDLSDLKSADTAGVCALRKLIDGGAVLQGASPYVAQLLATHDCVEESSDEE